MSQHIYSPIHHLKFKSHPYKTLPDLNDYKFSIHLHSPIGVNNSSHNQRRPSSSTPLPKDRSRPLEISRPSGENTIPNYLSPSEIADLGQFLEPLPKPFPIIHGPNPFDPTRLGWHYYLQYDPDHPLLPPEICIRSPDDASVDATCANNWGTSVKHYHRRAATIKQLTIYNNTFHDHMTMASHPSFTKPHQKWKRRRREYNEFMSSPFNLAPYPATCQYCHKWSDSHYSKLF
ncbi:unnamed protein product [Rhizophagus irregularis]|nr:unnamed protein product [Rhizophagus irregularis]